MGFHCPECEGSSLEIVNAIELGADGRSDEITVQLLECSACGFRGTAVYEESRRGALDSDCWTHTGFTLDPNGLERLWALILSCPERRKSSCECAAHRELRTSADVWPGLDSFGIAASFPMVSSPAQRVD